MQEPIIPRDVVAQRLAVSTNVLIKYEARGLVAHSRSGAVEGYSPDEIRRLWTIVSCQRDLGINVAGVEAILKLRDHLGVVHHQLAAVAHELREALDDEPPPDADA
jgi:MerR family transcriptional regulator/heat shock protein HspR